MSLVAESAAGEVRLLLNPIDPANPAGLFDMEDETYQAIDQEMVKLGGLHEGSIDWVYIEEASRQYLSQQCKHLRIVAHLGAAWMRSGCWEHWANTLALLGGMVEAYWETAHPKPGPKGFPGKRKLIGLVLNRLIDALPRLDRFSYSPARGVAAQQALQRLQLLQEVAQLDEAVLSQLERLLGQSMERADGADEPATPTPPASGIKPVSLAEIIATPTPSKTLGNPRETRQALLSMAEFVNQQDPYDPTGYQLRRFGLWAHLQSAPSAVQGNRTELMAVPADICSDYEDAVASTAMDAALLQQIEKSLTGCPYWIRGNFLAAAAATRLAMGEVAEAIRAATARFVQRMPALHQLCFSDGRAFVDDQCQAWLKGAGGQPGQSAIAQEFACLHEELASQLESRGIEPVLLRLQGMQAELSTPRERCHTTLIAADLLATRGVSWVASDLCAGIARTMQQTNASAWEPEVFERLQQYAAPEIRVDQNKDPR